jgi:AmmeMemoRadiSam system protein B
MSSSLRQAAVAGRFYPSDPDILRRDVRSYLSPASSSNEILTKIPAIGCVVPHAGYLYSGAVAGAVYRSIQIPSRVIILCPNHTGLGEPVSIMSSASWQTPFGNAEIDQELAENLKRRFPLLVEDSEAHRREHAIEVQLPFLQESAPDFRFVPVALGTSRYEILEALGEALAEVVNAEGAASGEAILIIASSDMNHYESDQITRVKDHLAIEKILALDPRGLFDVVMKERISMCGFGPTVSMLTAAKKVGAVDAELVQYATSGDVSGDRNLVVGYAGIVVK